MTLFSKYYRISQRRTRNILNAEWKPIEGAPSDEYDVYADRLVSLIVSHASDTALLQYLEAIQTEEMGLKPFDAKRGRKVIAAIRANMKLPQHASPYD